MNQPEHFRNRNYISINELSQITGFSVTQIRRLVAAEKIAFFQPGGKGGKLLFPPDALERRYSENPFARENEGEKPLPGPRPNWRDV